MEVESEFMGKPMSYWYTLSRRIEAGEDAFTVNQLLLENGKLCEKVGMYEQRIKALMSVYKSFNHTDA